MLADSGNSLFNYRVPLAIHAAQALHHRWWKWLESVNTATMAGRGRSINYGALEPFR